jgi:hypothetical protein
LPSYLDIINITPVYQNGRKRQWYELAIRHLYGSILLRCTSDDIGKVTNAATPNGFLGPLVKRLEAQDHRDQTPHLSILIYKCPDLIKHHETITGSRFKSPWRRFGEDPPTIPSELWHATGDLVAMHNPDIARKIYSFSSWVKFKLPAISGQGDVRSKSHLLQNFDFGTVQNELKVRIILFISTWDMPGLNSVWMSVRIESHTDDEVLEEARESLTTIKVHNWKLNVLVTR